MTTIGVIGMVFAAALSAATPNTTMAPASDLYNAAGRVAAIHYTTHGDYAVEVELQGAGMPYDGHVYEINLTTGDLSDWISEQGQVNIGDRVFCWMDSCGTTSVLDDEIDHIKK